MKYFDFSLRGRDGGVQADSMSFNHYALFGIRVDQDDLEGQAALYHTDTKIEHDKNAALNCVSFTYLYSSHEGK